MAKVQFVRGTASQFANLAVKDEDALYFISDERRIYKGAVPFTGGIFTASTSFPATGEINTLYVNTTTGGVQYWNGSAYQTVVMPQASTVNAETPSPSTLLTEAAIVDYVAAEVAKVDAAGLNSTITALSDAITSNATAIGSLSTAFTTLESAVSANTSTISGITSTIGSTTLSTTDQTLTGAINEVKDAVDTAVTDLTVEVAAKTDENYASAYEIKQGGTVLGTINVPKDMVVESGTVEEITAGADGALPAGVTEAGTYIVLTIANATNDKLYIPAKELIDVYTAAANATEVQLTVGADNVISAALVDKGVTKAKLEQDVQDSLGKADTAVQTVAEGATNGTIAVDGTDVAVHGLGTAAYTAVEDYEVAGAAAQALIDAKAYTNTVLTWNELA